MNKKILNIFFF